ncbi:MAG: AAA family ATPase [Pirellulaceae bacterium]|nr:AAA family ATPase [Pirellulaceae bacterium]
MPFTQLEKPDGPIVLERSPTAPEQVHLFDDESIWALNAALAARRPLLVRGEPGVGKTQLAQAAAVLLNRPLVSFVVDSQTEPRDLLWRFDAVQRLAEAQVLSAVTQHMDQMRERLAIGNFVRPGPVWWALDWTSAKAQAARLHGPEPARPAIWSPGDGCVLLIDEIDKAESDVPNGLLQSLGAAQFRPDGFEVPVKAAGEPALVVITTNEERALPDAFVRRCLVLFIALPDDKADLTELLIQRAQAHFPQASDELLRGAAEVLIEDRQAALDRQQTPVPGQAEYLDLVRAVTEIAPDDIARQKAVLDRVRRFVLDKSAGARQ